MWRALPGRFRFTKTSLPILAAVLMAGYGARPGTWSDIAPLPAGSPHPIAGASSIDLLPITTRLRKDGSIGSALLKTTSGHGGTLRQRPLGPGGALHGPDGMALYLRGPADALGRLPLASANATMGAPLDRDGAVAGVVVAGSTGPLLAPIGLIFQHLNLGLSLGRH